MKTADLIKDLLHRLDSGFGKWKCKELNLDCAACKAELVRSGLRWWNDLEMWDGKKSPEKFIKLTK